VVVVVVAVLMAALGVPFGIVRLRLGLLTERGNRHTVRYPPNRDIASPPWLAERS
jgi:hypothetical protein